MHGRKGRYRNKRRGLRVNCFCAFWNNVQAFFFSPSNVKVIFRAGIDSWSFQGGQRGCPDPGTVIPRKLPLIRGISWHLVSLFRKFFPLWDGHGPRKCRFLPRNWTNVQRWERFSRFRSNLSFSSTFASFSSRREPFKRTLLFERLPSGNWIRIFVLSSII